MSTAPLTEQPTDCASCRFFADHRGTLNDSVCGPCDSQGLGPLRRLANGSYRRTEAHKLRRGA